MAPLEEERSSQPLATDQSDDETRNESTRESSEGPAWYYEIEGDDEPEEDEDEDYEDQPDEEDEEEEEDDEDDDDDAIEGGGGTQRLLNIVRSNFQHPLLILQYMADALVTQAGARTGLLTRRQLLALMQDPNLTSVLFQDNADDDAEFLDWPFRRHRTPKDPNRFPQVPSFEGMKLMRSGVFGANDYNLRAQKRLATRMLERELALGNREDRLRNNALINQVGYCGSSIKTGWLTFI
jgi:WD repeat-containing protein 23